MGQKNNEFEIPRYQAGEWLAVEEESGYVCVGKFTGELPNILVLENYNRVPVRRLLDDSVEEGENGGDCYQARVYEMIAEKKSEKEAPLRGVREIQKNRIVAVDRLPYNSNDVFAGIEKAIEGSAEQTLSSNT